MFSSKVLILAVILTYCAVLVHSACEVNTETCQEKDLPKARKFVKAMKKCDDKEGKAKQDCQGGCLMILFGTDPANAVINHKCNLEHMDQMAEGADKECCETAVAYLTDCYMQVQE